MKFVLVGIPGVGKTTIRKMLEARGLPTIEEPNWKHLFEKRKGHSLGNDLAIQQSIRNSFLARGWIKGLVHERSLKDVHIFNEALKAKYPNQKERIDRFAKKEREKYGDDTDDDTVYLYLRTNIVREKRRSPDDDDDDYWEDVCRELIRLHDETYHHHHERNNVITFDVDTAVGFGSIVDKIIDLVIEASNDWR